VHGFQFVKKFVNGSPIGQNGDGVANGGADGRSRSGFVSPAPGRRPTVAAAIRWVTAQRKTAAEAAVFQSLTVR
jgi:hypothetical protein